MRIDSSNYKTINSTSLGVKIDDASNPVKTVPKRHRKTASEPNVEQYVLSQFNLNLNSKIQKLFLGKPPTNQNILFKSKLNKNSQKKETNLSSLYQSNKQTKKFTFNTDIEDIDKKPATASKKFFLDTNSSILKNRKFSFGYQGRSIEGNIYSFKIILDLKIHKGPLDILCILHRDPRRLREELTKIMTSFKISFKLLSVSI